MRGIRGTRENPARYAATQTNESCAIPANGTLQASANPIFHPIQLATKSAAIKHKFRSIGAAAAAINFPAEFSTPDIKAAREINKI